MFSFDFILQPNKFVYNFHCVSSFSSAFCVKHYTQTKINAGAKIQAQHVHFLIAL